MAFYYNPTDNVLYDTSVYPATSVPAGCIEITEENYKSKLDSQNAGWIITYTGGSIGLMDVIQSAATEMLHSAVIASTSVLGHVKIDASSPVGIDGNGCLVINNLGITTAMIAASAVTTAKIDDKAVTTAKIDDKAVTTAKIDDKAVTTAKIDDKAVTTAKIDDKAVTNDKIADANIDNSKLGAFCVHANNIDAKAVTTSAIDDEAVTNDKIAAGTILKSRLNINVIPYKIAATVQSGGSWSTPTTDSIDLVSFAANAGRVFDFTLTMRLDIPQTSSNTFYSFDIVVKTGVIENARITRLWKIGDIISVRLTYDGLGSGTTTVSVEHNDSGSSPGNLVVDKVEFAGIAL